MAKKNSYLEKQATMRQAKKMERLALDRVCDTLTNSPAYERYATQYSERAEIRSVIENAPTVEVVFCKDCYWNDRAGRCMNPKCGKSWYGCPVPDEHFCSYGEKREVE